MKKLLIATAAIAVFGLTAFSLNKNAEVKTNTVKIDKAEFNADHYGISKNDIATAD
ncbi:hypothetical protein [Mucilaginibacter sp. KACC 22063]|uniref:hypothetical protein n=1 Tax=Mucilaginibacter sp. KACC 22063 TaxID=3025666 RepID=UPI00236604AE|nr:hypothetical protein [Mucilaginibacter sp. KACC 22063]WDF54046.1 hypothetical protein PQ461_13955 [Mucilaginibacter sp. KACC 22063]